MHLQLVVNILILDYQYLVVILMLLNKFQAFFLYVELNLNKQLLGVHFFLEHHHLQLEEMIILLGLIQ